LALCEYTIDFNIAGEVQPERQKERRKCTALSLGCKTIPVPFPEIDEPK
jgi:hypothetical protein